MTDNYRIILDNAGGVTLQLGGWASRWADASSEELALSIQYYMVSGNTDGWGGHEDSALALDPTPEEVRNGGYHIVPLNGASVRSLVIELLHLDWGNSIELAKALAKYL